MTSGTASQMPPLSTKTGRYCTIGSLSAPAKLKAAIFIVRAGESAWSSRGVGTIHQWIFY